MNAQAASESRGKVSYAQSGEDLIARFILEVL